MYGIFKMYLKFKYIFFLHSSTLSVSNEKRLKCCMLSKIASIVNSIVIMSSFDVYIRNFGFN
jgi:hypothetical protein